MQKLSVLMWRPKTTEGDRQTKTKEEKKESLGESFGNAIPLGSHLSGVKGHDSIYGVAVICSFAFLSLSFLLPAVHLHHLLLLL